MTSACDSKEHVSCWLVSNYQLNAHFLYSVTVYSKHLARLMASFPYARCIISKVSAPDLPSFTQNLMFALCSSFTSILKSQLWRHTWWQTLVLCNCQCSHSDATRHTKWRRSLLPSRAHAFTYCHQVAVYGTSLETFWYTFVYVTL